VWLQYTRQEEVGRLLKHFLVEGALALGIGTVVLGGGVPLSCRGLQSLLPEREQLVALQRIFQLPPFQVHHDDGPLNIPSSPRPHTTQEVHQVIRYMI